MTTTVLAPAASVSLSAPVPYVVQSCVVSLPPPPAPAEGVITLPAPPTVEYEDLPVIDPDQYVDTSPDRILGCANSLPEGGEQAVLKGLFPAAVDGDGIIDRGTGNIWKYDGTDWENVGPNPGLILLDPVVLPPWNETEIYDATVRTRLRVQSLDYALALLTEPDPIGVVLGLDVSGIRSVKLDNAGSYEVEPLTPSIVIPEIVDPEFNSVVPVLYEGNGTTQTIASLPWSPGIVWIKRRDVNTANHVLFDVVRGATKYWTPDGANAEQTASTTLTSFDNKGFTVNSSFLVNLSANNYVAWAFAPLSEAETNTDGTITTEVQRSSFYSVVTYTGTGTADQTVGHGLGVTPSCAIIKQLPQNRAARFGSPLMGSNTEIQWTSFSIETTGSITSYDASTVGVTTAAGVDGGNLNVSARAYVMYAFRDVPGLCKTGIYTGNGSTGGQFIDCGMNVQMLLVKSRFNSSAPWHVIDVTRNEGNNVLLLSIATETTIASNFYELTGKGFTALRGTEDASHDLNISGTQYIYVAFGKFTATAMPPAAELECAAVPPSL